MGMAVPCTNLDSSTLSLGLILTATQQQNLLCPVTSDDIRKALLDIENDKASGLDSYGAKFFKAAWDTVNLDLQQAVEEFSPTSVFLNNGIPLC